jgi:hypothetical protein
VGSGGSIPGGSPSTPNGKGSAKKAPAPAGSGGSAKAAAPAPKATAKKSPAPAPAPAPAESGKAQSEIKAQHHEGTAEEAAGGADYSGFVSPLAAARSKEVRALSDAQIRAIRNRGIDDWGNSAKRLTPDRVANLESSMAERRRRTVNQSTAALAAVEPKRREQLAALSLKQLNAESRSKTSDWSKGELFHARHIAESAVLAESGLSSIELEDESVKDGVLAKHLGLSPRLTASRTSVLFTKKSKRDNKVWEQNPGSAERIAIALGIPELAGPKSFRAR